MAVLYLLSMPGRLKLLHSNLAVYASWMQGAMEDMGSVSKNILIENVTVSNLTSKVNEIVALVDSDGEVVLGPSGEVFQIEVCSSRETGAYVSTPLCDAQIALADLVHSLSIDAGRFGQLHIPKEIVAWAKVRVLSSYSRVHKVVHGQFSPRSKSKALTLAPWEPHLSGRSSDSKISYAWARCYLRGAG